MVYQIIWNNGDVNTFPFDRYSLKEIRDLCNEITLATRGAYTDQINLIEEDEI